MKGGGEAEVMGGCCLGSTPGPEEAPGPGVRFIPAMADMTESAVTRCGPGRPHQIKAWNKTEIRFIFDINIYVCVSRKGGSS